MNKNIKFTEEELVAVAKIGILMIEADYVIEKSETDNLMRDLSLLSDNEFNSEELIEKAKKQNHLNMISTISNLANDKKLYASAVLVNIMKTDSKIEEEEIAMLNFAAEMCHLPYISLKDARKLLEEL